MMMRTSELYFGLMKALLALSFFMMSGSAFAAVDLDAVFARAVTLSESVAGSRDAALQADEQSYQAGATLLPFVFAFGSIQNQERVTNAFGTSISPANQETFRLTATQPVFRGFAEYAGIRQRKENQLAAESGVQESQRQLYLDVVTRFYNVLGFERSLDLLQQEIKVHEKRIKEQKEFERVGRAKHSDVLQTESLQATRRADYSLTSISLEQERIQLLRVAGIARNEILKDTYSLPTKLPNLQEYLRTSSTRSDLVTIHHQYLAAEEQVAIARGSILPAVDLNGNYWIKRPGVVKDVSWDVSIVATMPIFNGGIRRSQIRQAQAARHQAEMTHLQQKEIVAADVESLYERVRIGKERIDALESAQMLSAKTAELFQKDYKLGLTSNLEVLQAISQAQESQRLLDLAKLGLKADFVRLELASGKKTFGTKTE